MKPLVLVHGFMGGSAQWDGYTTDLQATRNVIAIDLPGFGANAHLPPIPSITGYARWVVEHLGDLNVLSYDLLGHSMGGMIAQEIARLDSRKIGRLVLYATGAFGVLPGRFETIEESKKRADSDGPSITARRIAATWFLEGEDADGYEPCATVAALTGMAAIHAGLDAMQTWSGKQCLNLIDLQTLVLWGDQDRTYPWSQIQCLWEGIEGASLAVVPGCAHAIHAEKPDLFQKLVADFLSNR